MRVALMILLGLVIGVIGTVNVMSALAARDPMPKAVMATMNYHMNALSQMLKTRQCAAAGIRQHLERVQSTATDIVPTFGIPDRPFADASSLLQTRVAQALQSAPASCPALALAVTSVGQACKSCHDTYR